MNKFLEHVRLRFHEGKGPTLTVTHAERLPAWIPLWVTCHAVEEFNCENTWHGKLPEITDSGGLYYSHREEPPSGVSVFKQKADLVMNIPFHKDAGGFAFDRLRIIGGIAPQCLTNQIPRKRIIEAPDFRNLHAKGYFNIITSQFAAMLMQDPEVKEALALGTAEEQARRLYYANPSGRGVEATWRQ